MTKRTAKPATLGPCDNCKQEIRPRGTTAAQYQNTVLHGSKQRCATCAKHVSTKHKDLPPTFPCPGCGAMLRRAAYTKEQYPNATRSKGGRCWKCNQIHHGIKPKSNRKPPSKTPDYPKISEPRHKTNLHRLGDYYEGRNKRLRRKARLAVIHGRNAA